MLMASKKRGQDKVMVDCKTVSLYLSRHLLSVLANLTKHYQSKTIKLMTIKQKQKNTYLIRFANFEQIQSICIPLSNYLA